MLNKVRLFTFFLLIVLLVGILCACGNRTTEIPSTSTTPGITANVVEVIYFHRTQRCNSCTYAENGTRYTLETYFKEELASDRISFKSINVEDKKNTVIVKKYGAFTSSLFINTIKDGTDHIVEVKEIWFVLGKDKAFVELIKGEIEESLEGIR